MLGWQGFAWLLGLIAAVWVLAALSKPLFHWYMEYANRTRGLGLSEAELELLATRWSLLLGFAGSAVVLGSFVLLPVLERLRGG